MKRKVMEICYDLAASQSALHAMTSRSAHAFRDGAARVVGRAISSAGLGRVEAAEDGFGEVRLRLRVTDFDEAEKVICRATSSTPFAGYREVLCYWEETKAA